MSRYPNIDYFYGENKQLLLESDDYRLCKSIPRNIESYVDKFEHYYRIHKGTSDKCEMDEDTITYDVLNLEQWSDVVTTAKRIMKEFDFLRELDLREYETTETFDAYVFGPETFNTYLMNKLKEIHSMNEMSMVYNSIICALREGYLYGKILVFPDGANKFKQAVTNKADRDNFRKRVYDLYGFAGRYHDCTRDDYTPNANYRIVTVLSSLGFIEQIPSDFDDVRAYGLTQKAFDYLDLLNANFGTLDDSKFDELIEKENDYNQMLIELSERYGIEGTIRVTTTARLPQVQEIFKERLIKKYGQKCMMCGVTHSEMLIASHIKRASEEDIFGKADFNNGFLLCATHDKLFDRYLISFNCFTGQIMISTSLSDEEKKILGLDENFCLDAEYMTEDRVDYLMDHNQKFMERESERQ